jgi:PAS domain S-box-containing protein
MSATRDRISGRSSDTRAPDGFAVPESEPAAGDRTLWMAPTATEPRVDYRRRTDPLSRVSPAAAPPRHAPAQPGDPAGNLIAGPNDVTVVLDQRGVVVSVSPNCPGLLGFEREDLIGVHVRELIHPEDQSSLASATRAFAEGLTDHLHSVQRVRHRQRGYRLVETALRSTAPSPGRRPAGAVVLVRSPQTATPEAGRPSVSMAPAAIGTAYAWVMHGSRRAVIASADPVFASLLGTTTARLVGRPIEELTDPDNHAVGVARFLALLDGSGSTYVVERLPQAGHAAVELTVSLLPLLDKPGHMAVIQARDVSRQREVEQAVQSSLTELQRSNRELEAFASVAAHDLSAPLRVVVGYAEMLAQQDDHVNPQIAELLGKVASTSRRMQAQVDGLMTLARMESEELTTSTYDVRMLVDEALESLEEDIGRTRTRLQVGTLPQLCCNATGIVQVLQNLISNAIKYGGDHPAVNIDAIREPQAWRIIVRDRGIGLPEGDERDLFELFERGQARPGVAGAGIGLAVCQRIVERHGGRIWASQRSGGGSEFQFTLPDQGASAVADQPVPRLAVVR